MAVRTKAAPKPKRYAVAKAIGSTDAQLLIGTIADSQASETADCDLYWLLYKKHPWIRACIRIISNAVAQGGFSVGLIDGDDTQGLPDNDTREQQIREFFRGAFAPKTFRQAMKSVAVDLELFGCAYWKKVTTNGILSNLERLDPRLIVPKLNADKTEIDHYQVRKNQLSGTGVIVEQAGSDDIPADEVIRFSLDEGGDCVFGSPSPLEALDLTTAMDLNIRKHRNSFFKNGAAVGNVFINKEADEDQVRAAIKGLTSMKTGATNAYSNLILTGDWELASMMQGGKHELDFLKSTEIVRDEICAVYSVPVSKLMNTAGAMGQSGKGEDDETFEQECVLPLEELIYEKITVEILHKFEGMEDVEIVPKRRNSMRFDRIASAMNMVKCGATGNEARDIIGLARSDAPGMDIPLFIGATAQGVVSDEIAEPIAPQAASGDGSINESNDEIDKQDEVGQKAGRRFPYYR